MAATFPDIDLLGQEPDIRRAELLQRYNALPAVEDLPNERTWLSRVATPDDLLRLGAWVAGWLRFAAETMPGTDWDCGRPDLAALILEAWPER
jgi:hypothetical protein